MSTRTAAPTQYPCPTFSNKKQAHGEVIDLYERTKANQKTYLGRFNSMAEAREAYDRYKATGERPPKRPYTRIVQERTARIHPRNVKSGVRYDVKGKLNGEELHIGTGATMEQAEAIKAHFLATGETSSRTYSPRGTRAPRVYKPRQRVQAYKPHKEAKNPRGPRTGPRLKAKDVKILPGRNLRDHEIEALEAAKPELVRPLTERHRKPGESIGDWYKRLAAA